MTRDEHRAKCIEAMIEAYRAVHASSIKAGTWSQLSAFTAAFDSLHDIARVNPIEATEEMIEASASALFSKLHGESLDRCKMLVQFIYDAMSIAGNLTNVPEKKT